MFCVTTLQFVTIRTTKHQCKIDTYNNSSKYSNRRHDCVVNLFSIKVYKLHFIINQLLSPFFGLRVPNDALTVSAVPLYTGVTADIYY